MPGMMETILNLGLNDTTVAGLERLSGNPSFAWDSYRRFVQMYGGVVFDVPKKLSALEARYTDAQLSHLDGISADYPDWHFNVRASNTEPLLRLNLEATSPELMERRRDEVLEIIRG